MGNPVEVTATKPYLIRKQDDGTFNVYKRGGDGEPTGDAVGTGHASESAAQGQIDAIYAHEKAVKDCVGDKIAKLIKEGKPQDQAAAIAYSMCGEKAKADALAAFNTTDAGSVGFGVDDSKFKRGASVLALPYGRYGTIRSIRRQKNGDVLYGVEFVGKAAGFAICMTRELRPAKAKVKTLQGAYTWLQFMTSQLREGHAINPATISKTLNHLLNTRGVPLLQKPVVMQAIANLKRAHNTLNKYRVWESPEAQRAMAPFLMNARIDIGSLVGVRSANGARSKARKVNDITSILQWAERRIERGRTSGDPQQVRGIALEVLGRLHIMRKVSPGDATPGASAKIGEAMTALRAASRSGSSDDLQAAAVAVRGGIAAQGVGSGKATPSAAQALAGLEALGQLLPQMRAAFDAHDPGSLKRLMLQAVGAAAAGKLSSDSRVVQVASGIHTELVRAYLRVRTGDLRGADVVLDRVERWLPVALNNARERSAPPTRAVGSQKAERKPLDIQTIIVSKQVADNVDDARKKVPEGMKREEVDVTEASYRFRQRDPGEFSPDSFRTFTPPGFPEGVTAVGGKLKQQKIKSAPQPLDLPTALKALQQSAAAAARKPSDVTRLDRLYEETETLRALVQTDATKSASLMQPLVDLEELVYADMNPDWLGRIQAACLQLEPA